MGRHACRRKLLLGAWAVLGAWVAASSASAQTPVPAVPDVPRTLPEPFAVMAFENRSGVAGLGWMSAGVAFIAGEKAESTGRLRASYGPLVVPTGAVVPASPEAVAAFAVREGVHWVWTGWFERPNWKLRLGVGLWRVDGKDAKLIGEATGQGEFKEVHQLLGTAMLELLKAAGMAANETEKSHILRSPSEDFYAFTLFGRGLSAWLGISGAVNLTQAEKDLRKAIRVEPKLTEAQRVTAQLFRLQNKTDAAAARLGYALEVRPDYYPATVAQATLAQASNQQDRALELYRSALRLRPYDLEVRFRYGRALWESGLGDAAYDQLSQVVTYVPSDLRARRVLVMVHAARGDGADLISQLEAVARLDPADKQTLLDLGAAYSAGEQLDDAIAVYKRVVDLDHKHVQAMKLIGDLYKQRDDLKSAVRYYSMALRTKPDDPRPYFLLGAAYVALGNDQQAKHTYRQAQRFKRYLPEVYNNLGAIAYREGKYGESVWYLKRAVHKRPGRVRYRYNYALSLSSKRESDLALEQIDEGLRLDDSHAELHYLRGVVFLKRGSAAAARKEFERTVELDDSHEGAKHNLVMLDEIERTAREGEVVVEGRD